MILDTNAVSDLFRGNQKLAERLEKTDALHLPVIVIGEYLFGLETSKHRDLLSALLKRLAHESKVLAVDSITAKHYAKVKARLKSKGTPIPENDIWIASLALQHKEDILSLDQHFDRVEEIERIGW